MQFRKATKADIPAVAAIYADTHTEIEAGRLSVGWIRSIYPGVHTAEAAVEREWRNCRYCHHQPPAGGDVCRCAVGI